MGAILVQHEQVACPTREGKMMNLGSDAQHRIEAYLTRLRRCLRVLSDEDAREIVGELRSHITDKALATGEATTTGVDTALATLGSPEELASEYLTDALLARAEVSRSPARIIVSLFQWASLSLAGFFVLLASITGYLLGILIIVPTILKPFHPQNAGLWVSRGSDGDLAVSLRLGLGGGAVPVDARDVLGWWFVPVGMVVGCGLVMLTTRFALWCARQYRSSRALPPG